MKVLAIQIIGIPIFGIIGLVFLLTVAPGCSKKVQKMDMLDFQTVEAPEKHAVAIEAPDVPEAAQHDDLPVARADEPDVVVYFDFDSSKLLPQEAMKLDKIWNKPIKAVGHACVVGTEEYNMGLGLKRANTVKTYHGSGDVSSVGEFECLATCESIYEQECKECRKVDIFLK